MDDQMDVDGAPSSTSMELVPAAGEADSKQKKRKECQICFDTASGCHFGVLACEGCKGFFRRNIQKNAKFVCFYDNKCDVFGIKKRKSCQKCRMEACLKQGMNAAMIKKNNIRKPGERRKDKPTQDKSRSLAIMGSLGKIDKTAGFKSTSMRHSITSLTQSSMSLSNQNAQNTGVASTNEDSGFVTLNQHDDNQSSVISHGSTNVSTCSRQSVLRQSEAGTGRIFVIDCHTKEKTLDVHSMIYKNPNHRVPNHFEGNSMTLSDHVAPSRVHSMPGGLGSSSYGRTSGVLREPSICSDSLTRDIFNNMDKTLEKVRELCNTCYQYNTLVQEDAKKLFQAAKYELVFVYIYFENRQRVNELGEQSSPMMRGLIESLEKCEISSWNHIKSIIMMSLLAHDRMATGSSTFYQNLEQIKSLRRETQDELSRTMSDLAQNGLQRYINVMLLLPVLREMNEYWCSCPIDTNGCPILVDRNRVRFG